MRTKLFDENATLSLFDIDKPPAAPAVAPEPELFGPTPDQPKKSAIYSLATNCLACKAEINKQVTRYEVALCDLCYATDSAAFDEIERQMIEIENNRLKAWQPLVSFIGQLDDNQHVTYATIWRERWKAETVQRHLAIENRVWQRSREATALGILLRHELDGDHVTSIMAAYDETTIELRTLYYKQATLLAGLKSKWSLPDELAKTRQATPAAVKALLPDRTI